MLSVYNVSKKEYCALLSTKNCAPSVGDKSASLPIAFSGVNSISSVEEELTLQEEKATSTIKQMKKVLDFNFITLIINKYMFELVHFNKEGSIHITA